ncbi:hypothetical protein [Primorskyibacter sp. S87]|uniref:hypothetical protein n=1 Tax=Primorskyibacter sp. S87 TaxID=3415126 RepID=UPI003C7B8F12
MNPFFIYFAYTQTHYPNIAHPEFDGITGNGVKWQDGKVMFKENASIFDETLSFDTPRVYNLLNDPNERESVLFPHTWAVEKAQPELLEHAETFKQYPPIPPGTPDPYVPPKD